MTARYLLDASAILALLNEERGAQTVADALRESVVSVATVIEVVGKLQQRGSAQALTLATRLPALGVQVEPLTSEDVAYALAVQALDDRRRDASTPKPNDERRPLSLGDRCCLATSLRMGLVALTGDHVWAKLGEPVRVELFR